jgi:drug/metabolite transporter (DMT)-like permease
MRIKLKQWFRPLLDPTLLAVPGAFAQAGNNVASGFVRQAMLQTAGVDAWQAMFAALTIAFVTTAAICVGLHRVYKGTDKQFQWSLPNRSVFFLHELRLAVGGLATLLIFGAAQEAAASGNPPVAMITVLSSTGALWVAANDLRKYLRIDGVFLVIAQISLTAIGFGGILIATWSSVVGVREFSFAIAAAGFAGFLLGCLQLIQSRLVKTAKENAVKVVGYFAFQASLLSALGLVVSSWRAGVLPQLTLPLLGASLALGLCYGVSQITLQLANGFGSPSVVGVIIYLGIPAGYGFDFLLFHKSPSIDQIVGSCFILLAAVGIKLIQPLLPR